jgi:hypothetical protein
VKRRYSCLSEREKCTDTGKHDIFVPKLKAIYHVSDGTELKGKAIPATGREGP